MPRTEVFNREEVITKARDVFWLKGYNGTSMQDLVDATGLNRSSIYNSFGSKMELYRNCLSAYQRNNVDYIESLFARAETPLKGIRELFCGAVQQISADHQDKGCMVVNCNTEMANQDHGLQNWLHFNQNRMINLFQTQLDKAQQAGEIGKNKNTEVLANYLMSLVQGLRVFGTQVKEPKVLQDMVNHALSTLN